MVSEYLYENRWWIGLRGVLAIIFGVLAFVWPLITAFALIYLFGAYVILDGILAFFTAFRRRQTYDRWWLFLLEGVVDIAAGVIAFLFPGLAAITLVFVVAIWAIITGIIELASAIRLRQEIENEWALALAGVVSIILGVIIILNPGAGLIGLVWAIGGYAIIFGILMLILALRARSLVSTGANRPTMP